MLIGHLTTPPNNGGIGLNEYWAYVRYFNAVTSDSTLRLTREYSELDSHQKTILSDDFGMGFSMQYLCDVLQSGRMPIDGRYFVKKMAATLGATYTGASKRGPGKSPDFVFEDAFGRWHIVECKGTQTSEAYREDQLSAGSTQKKTVLFPSALRGEQLVTGLYIAVEGQGLDSSLVVSDPEPDDRMDIGEQDMDKATDTADRASLALALQLAGLPATSSIVASPDGPKPEVREQKGVSERRRRAGLQRRRESSIEELRAANDAVSKGGAFGRTAEFELPALRTRRDDAPRRVRVSYQVDPMAFQGINEFPTYEFGQLLEEQFEGRSFPSKLSLTSTENSAELSLGQYYKASIKID